MILESTDYYSFPVSLLLGSARALGFVAIHPMFSWLQLDVRLRLAIAVGLSGKSITNVMASDQFDNPALILVAALAIKEIIVGISFGLILGLPIYGLQAAGDILDYTRGGLAADHLDPISASTSSESARLLSALALLWMVVSGAFSVSLEILSESFSVIPLASFDTNLSWDPAIGLLHSIATYGVKFAFPLFILMLAVQIAWSLAGMGENSIKAEDVTTSVKSLILLVGLPIYLVALLSQLGDEFKAIVSMTQELIRVP